MGKNTLKYLANFFAFISISSVFYSCTRSENLTSEQLKSTMLYISFPASILAYGFYTFYCRLIKSERIYGSLYNRYVFLPVSFIFLFIAYLKTSKNATPILTLLVFVMLFLLSMYLFVTNFRRDQSRELKMEIEGSLRFPLLLLGKNRPVGIFVPSQEMQYNEYLYAIDDDNSMEVYDVDGKRVAFLPEKKGLKLKVLSNKGNVSVPFRKLIKYTKYFGKNSGFVYKGNKRDLVGLFYAIEMFERIIRKSSRKKF